MVSIKELAQTTMTPEKKASAKNDLFAFYIGRPVSYVLTLLDISNTPLMLGMILEKIMESNFVSASMAYDRDYTIFIRRPISAVILVITIVLLVSMMRVNKRIEALNAQQEAEMAAEHAKMDGQEEPAAAN